MSFRSRARELAMQTLYQNQVQNNWERRADFTRLDAEPHPSIAEFAVILIEGTAKHLEEIDRYIEDALKRWKMDRVGGVEKAILRLSVFSLLYQPDISVSIVVDEAIELAKTFCEDKSFSFINGVLDAVASHTRKA